MRYGYVSTADLFVVVGFDTMPSTLYVNNTYCGVMSSYCFFFFFFVLKKCHVSFVCLYFFFSRLSTHFFFYWFLCSGYQFGRCHVLF